MSKIVRGSSSDDILSIQSDTTQVWGGAGMDVLTLSGRVEDYVLSSYGVTGHVVLTAAYSDEINGF